ncbi:prolyl oligopeptidase family serine peptidase [Flavitalea sp. BT771]|uniref:S9 family peptidase n=1 Tax=Flavitalea sp. BT771 TaxID=3063329 RepID=UPI0026E2D2A0|nr:alpha/beta fold hydrolase [Flavitalea sp. BT771]MDO6429824.1 prolyl oligopeptidase family serine peptidase [Flavitalea sp. BT771]MDV6218048.1 prolyl oligopeptidase family serine peptidase [Flavitalea sp. BT771]
MPTSTLKKEVSACFLGFLLLSLSNASHGQTPNEKLTVEKIMQDPKWIGTSPSDPYWSGDGKYLFFKWNPDRQLDDSLYYITKENLHPQKASYALQQSAVPKESLSYNVARSACTYAREGDIFYTELKTHQEKRITRTADKESSPLFSFHDSRVVYTRGGNLYSWDIASGATEQLTNFQHTPAPPDEKKDNLSRQEKWLQNDQLQQFDILKSRKRKKDIADAINKAREPKPLKNIYIDDKELTNLVISPTGRFITYRLTKRPTDAKTTIVPSYVTETGFTRDIPGRTKVGVAPSLSTFYVFDAEKDTVLTIATDQLPGIADQPDYVKDYPDTSSSHELRARSSKLASFPAPSLVAGSLQLAASPASRPVTINGPWWSEQGMHAVVDIRSQDNKDRWLMILDAATGKLSPLDRQRDEAWIGGPGIGRPNLGWIDENTCWFQSEATGYSHIYKADVSTGAKTRLTGGRFEILQAALSQDKKRFYISTNEVRPGEQQFYQLPVTGGKAQRITTLTGANLVTLSPDEKQLAILYSYTNKPWELYLQDNMPGSQPHQVTNLAMSDTFRAYPWRDPDLITFQASDGATVYARIYRPHPDSPHLAAYSSSPGARSSQLTAQSSQLPALRPAVIFVHGAGYLQNAHKWWSSYFREYMFNNLLADNGYTVLDIDYRGSAGYGRDWRTGIYRHMGGKDLSDQVDGVRYLVEREGVDPKRIGIYGGSYGGFITLMALFTEPDVFTAGAGLRSVTDWAHYNHGYTANILNEPFSDSLAYHRSSPLYFADGLKGHLLMCHGMVDENVHFQDIVRLTQRLIELHKDNWELAVYPVEDHGFLEPSSWTDEYKRIFRLFETWLK